MIQYGQKKDKNVHVAHLPVMHSSVMTQPADVCTQSARLTAMHGTDHAPAGRLIWRRRRRLPVGMNMMRY